MTSTDIDRLARTAYEAHRAPTPGPSRRGKTPPQQEKQAWRAAVSAVTGPADATLTEAPARPVDRHPGRRRDAHLPHRIHRGPARLSLVISDEHASSQHALFQPAHGYWFVQDLDSTNGTWLNGRRVYRAQRLKKGDKIKIGRTIVAVVAA